MMVEKINLNGLFDRPRWTGPVERRDPDAVRGKSFIDFWRCPNPVCGHWTPLGSRAMRRCLRCLEPMPDYAREGRPFP